MTADVIPNVAAKVCVKMVPFKFSVLSFQPHFVVRALF